MIHGSRRISSVNNTLKRKLHWHDVVSVSNDGIQLNSYAYYDVDDEQSVFHKIAAAIHVSSQAHCLKCVEMLLYIYSKRKLFSFPPKSA